MKTKTLSRMADTLMTGGIFLSIHAFMEHGVSWNSFTSPLTCFGMSLVCAVTVGIREARAEGPNSARNVK